MHLVYRPPPPPPTKKGGTIVFDFPGDVYVIVFCFFLIFFWEGKGEGGSKHKVHYGFGENGERKV